MPSTASSLLLRVGAKTHLGLVRDENQDRMSRISTPLGEVFIVADGVGGHRGGATAAMMTVEGLDKYLQATNGNESPPMALLRAAQQANAEIYQLAYSGDPSVARMGSTVVLALVSDRQLLIAHAGDSRAYLYRDGQLQRLTRDHSVIQKMVDHNLLTEEEARDHPEANVIDRAFGQKPDIELELSAPLEIQPGDGVLLCSDGLCGYVDDAAIARVLSTQAEAQQITDELIELALSAGGKDNVTIQFLQFGSPVVAAIETRQPDVVVPVPQPEKRKPRRRLLFVILLVGVFLLGMLVMVTAGRLRNWFERSRTPAVIAPTPAASTSAEEEKKKNQEPAEPTKTQPADAPAQNR